MSWETDKLSRVQTSPETAKFAAQTYLRGVLSVSIHRIVECLAKFGHGCRTNAVGVVGLPDDSKHSICMLPRVLLSRVYDLAFCFSKL